MQESAEVYATSMLHRNIDELTSLSESIVVGSVVAVSDDFPEATAITCGTTTANTEIDPLGDVDFFTFTIAADSIVEIDIDADEFGSTLDPVLGLFDAGTVLLLVSDDNPAPGEPFTLDSFLDTSLTPGTYFIGVSAFFDFDFDGVDGSSTGFYDLSLSCTLTTPPAPGDLLASTGGQGGSLIQIDPATGAGVFRSPHGAFGSVTEIEFRNDGTLFGATGGGTSRVITIDPVTGIESLVGTHVFGAVNGMEFVSSTLYGIFIPFPGDPSELAIVDQVTGQLTSIGATGLSNVGGLAFDAATSTMYGATSGGSGGNLFTIDLATGAATLVGATGFTDVAALEFRDDGTLFGGLGGNSANAGSLITIDPATGAATLVGPTGFPVVSGLSFVPIPIFADGFESGDTSAWSATVP